MLKNHSQDKLHKLEQEIDSNYHGVYAYPHDSEEEKEKNREIMKRHLKKRNK